MDNLLADRLSGIKNKEKTYGSHGDQTYGPPTKKLELGLGQESFA